MKNDAIVKSIQSLLTEYKQLSPLSPSYKEDVESLRYLLLQSIRQYDIPLSKRHVSERAFNRWNDLTSQCIKDCHYRDKVICDRLTGSKKYDLFKGASGTGCPTTLTTKSTFLFREMFHEDHVIPVSVILEELKKIKNTTIGENDIKALLNEMHLCVLLKEEDRNIGRTCGRKTIDFPLIISSVYNDKGINLYPKPLSLI